MKYKRLKAEDLQALEKEFIHFLSAAQITGSDWDKMKKENVAGVEELLDVFSDMVYEKITGKIDYLEQRTELDLRIFYFGPEKAELIGLKAAPGAGIDLRRKVEAELWDGAVKIYHSEKPYVKDRQVEIFEMLGQGCEITDEKLFRLLKGML
ncbi:MAG: DUF6495 family protein [Bacteroidia bacterium]